MTAALFLFLYQKRRWPPIRPRTRPQSGEKAATQAGGHRSSGGKTWQATVSTGSRFRLLSAGWEKCPPNPDRRRDHSFFARAIAAIKRLILPDWMLNAQDRGAARRAESEGILAMSYGGLHGDRLIVHRRGPRR
jgi:hypothetical protein